MPTLFDSHSHYYDEKFMPWQERDELLLEILQHSDVKQILHAGTNPENSRTCIELAHRFEGTVASVGMHPGDCRDIPYSDAIIADFERMLEDEKVVAIGEIGLDFYWEPYDRAHQTRWFEAQMELARKTGYPVIIHDREAHGATLDVIRRFPDVVGVMHSYSASAEMVPELVRRGWYFSFSGVITFKNATKVLDAVRAVPADRILVETDCPYLSPVPYRGKRNSSSYLVHTAMAAAQARGEDFEEFCIRTVENTRRLFRL